MDVSEPDDGATKKSYTTPRWVQVWFLSRSRDRWKQKYQKLKTDSKRLQNRVADVTKSRAQWRQQAEQLAHQVRELQAQNAALQAQAAALKKGGPPTGARPG